VSQVRTLGAEVANVVTYTVVVKAQNRDGKLLPGMTANAEITAAHVNNVLRIANDATRFQPPKELADALGLNNRPPGQGGPGGAPGQGGPGGPGAGGQGGGFQGAAFNGQGGQGGGQNRPQGGQGAPGGQGGQGGPGGQNRGFGGPGGGGQSEWLKDA